MRVTIEELGTAVVPSESRKGRVRGILSSHLIAWLGLTGLFVSLPLYFLRHAKVDDPDIWWHLRAGEWMLQNHRILHFDLFSVPTMGRPWVNYSWLFDVGAYWAVMRFDLVSLWWYETLMRLAVTAALLSLVRSVMPQFWRGLAVVALAMLAMAPMFPPRPGVFSILFLIVELRLLLWAQQTSHRGPLWALPALFALWANIHIQVMYGLFVLGVFCIEPLLERVLRIPAQTRVTFDGFHRNLWVALATSFLATLVNPYGFGLFRTALQYGRDTGLYEFVTELRAMNFRTLNDWAVLCLFMLGCFALGRTRRFRPIWVVLLGWSAWMGFRSIREAWLVAIFSVVVFAMYKGEGRESEARPRTSLSMRIAVTATVMIILVAGAVRWSVTSSQLLRQLSQVYPLGAVAYIREHRLQGPLLNEFSWGGFLIYSLPEIPVAMDGRSNVHSQAEIQRAFALWNGEPGWQNRPELNESNLILSNHFWPLARRLQNDPRFRIVYQDAAAVLFEAVHSPAK